MAINYTVSYTFAPNTTISSSQVNTNFSDNANTWVGLEALTKSFAKLKVDVDPTTSLEVATKQYVDHYSTYRRPNLVYSSDTVVNIETGLNGTSGQAMIQFPDGTQRTDSTTGRIYCNLAQNAVLSGTAKSGLRTGTQTSNTWYFFYVVKVSDSTTNFVTVADTVFPTQANFATLNSNFGTNSWVYLGCLRNGDGLSSNVILKFLQNGSKTILLNYNSGGNAINSYGMSLNTTSGATSLSWAYASGTSGAVVPSTLGIIDYQVGMANGGTTVPLIARGQSNAGDFFNVTPGASGAISFKIANAPATEGISLTNGATSRAFDIFLTGWFDPILGVGSNPLL